MASPIPACCQGDLSDITTRGEGREGGRQGKGGVDKPRNLVVLLTWIGILEAQAPVAFRCDENKADLGPTAKKLPCEGALSYPDSAGGGL